jgi:hypothetical protein
MTHYETWSLIVTAAGVVVGVGVLVVYVLQLKAMRASVAASEKATEAAMLNAQAFIESQRPQIAATAHGNPAHTLADRDAPRVEIELFNRGATSAYNLIYESWIEILPPDFEDFTPAADYFKAAEFHVLYPHHDPIVINIPFRKGLSEQQLSELKQLHAYCYIRLRVQYRDTVSPQQRYSNFGFVVLGNGLGFLPKYNDAGVVP